MFVRNQRPTAILAASLLVLCALAPTPVEKAAAQAGRIRRLEPGTPVERELNNGEKQVYGLKLSAGQFFEICTEGFGVMVDVAVYSPGGRLVAQGDGMWGRNECDLVSYIAAEEGEYRIEVGPLFPIARAGRYRLKLVELRAAVETDRHRASANRAFADAQRRRARWSEEAPQTLAKFEEALAEWQAAGDRFREALTDASLATFYRRLGDLPKSTVYYERALEIFRAEGRASLEVETMADLAYCYVRQGQGLRGVALIRQALDLGRARGDQNGQCRALILLGGVSNATGNVRKGIEYNRQALPFCRAIGLPVTERIVLKQMADSYVSLGEPQQARDYFNQALQVEGPVLEPIAEWYIYLGLARLEFQTGELQGALAQAQRALEVARQLGSSDWEGETQLVLGRIYRALGDTAQAYAGFSQALDLSVAASDPHVRARGLSELADVAIRLGQRAEAERYLKSAAEAFRETPFPSSDVEAFKQLGHLELLRENPAAAVDYFQQAVALSRRQELAALEIESLWLQGSAALAAGAREPAAASLTEALGKAREKRLPDYEIQALGGLARLARERRDDREAQTLLESALDLIETSRARIVSPEFRVTFFSTTQSFYESYVDALMRRHELEREQGESRFVALALQAVERARARSLLELLTEAHAEIREGIDPALLNRERELQQRLSAKAERLWLMGQSARSGEQSVLRAEMEALTVELRDLAAQIRVRSPRYAALRQPQPLTLSEIQQRVLDPGTLLLEYALGEKRSFLFAVTPTEIRSFVLPGRAEIETQARRMLALLEAAGRPEAFNSIVDERRSRHLQLAAVSGPIAFKSAAAKRRAERRLQREYLATSAAMSRILLAPAGELLKQRRLLIVSDGVLHYLPFAALPDPMAAPDPRPAAPPLIVSHEIVMLPSASTLALLRQELQGREAAPKTLAVLADPVFNRVDRRLAGPVRTRAASRPSTASNGNRSLRGEISEDLFRAVGAGTDPDPFIPRLPGTRREAEAILSLVPEAQRKAAFDFDASFSTATSSDLSQYRYLHFATHGLLNSDHPELSGLVLSMVDKEGRRQQGILRAQDLYNLKLPAELVVLSACRTALGKESSGEGMIGLTRGFFYAGARRVIASLWMVNDVATEELMRRLYQEMLGEARLSPAAALRAAQISMWREPQWKAPYYWAAFTLQGEW